MSIDQQPTYVALLIVDVQQGFLRRPFHRLVERIEQLQSHYQTIFATRFYNDEPSNFRRLINWTRMARNSLDFELAFTPDVRAIILDKSIYTCVNPDFISRLTLRKITDVHLCGIDTDICVTKCAVDLFESGFRPVVLSAYCATNAGEEINQAALHILERYIGKAQVI